MREERTGGQILVDQLGIHGVDHLFCVPGESFLAVLDALYDAPLQVTVCRQEGGAAMMAEAYGKLTGRPGICFVTRGPGATNAQERAYPGRVSATDLNNPDFAAYAHAFGGHGERVEANADFVPVLERALASRKPAILHCLIDPEAITPTMTLTAIREKALAGAG